MAIANVSGTFYPVVSDDDGTTFEGQVSGAFMYLTQ